MQTTSAMPRGIFRANCRRSLIAGALSLAALCSVGTQAEAATWVFYEGPITMTEVKESTLALLSEVSARKLGGAGNACILAREGSVAVGTMRCTPVTNDVVAHPYCACAWRQGMAFPSTGGTVNLRARIDY